MDFKNSPNGSEWRRWDLHIHTPDTKLSNDYGSGEDIWERYVDYLENSPVVAFGITDYFSADGYYKLLEMHHTKFPSSIKVFFLNIEFRLAEAISKDSSNPHIHVIFDNDELSCNRVTISRFLSSLKTLDERETGVKVSCADLCTPSQFESASITIESLKTALHETFGDSKPYLIAFPAKNDGVRSTDSSSPRKVLITDKIDKMSDFFFGDSSSKDYFLRKDRYENGISLPKAVVSGSDAHSFTDLERLEGDVAEFEPSWIKCDLTFRGLQQICFEPDSRVYIGTEPSVEVRKTNQATKFLSQLEINNISTYDGSNGEWFSNVKIPLNPELTVIIGNKGSGKSAIVDIIGLLGESRQEEYFSFLSDKGSNKKFKQRGYSENFEAELTWQSSVKILKNLNDRVDKTKPEAIRYLPQNYFEQLTNEIEIEEFRKEIEDVVFSHVEVTDRMGKDTFADLQEFKTQQSKQETSSLKTKLRELNIEIVNCEEQADPLYKQQLEGELKAKNEELISIDKAKPIEVNKPGEETGIQRDLSKKIEALAEKRDKLEDTGKKTVEVVVLKKNKLQKLTSLLQSVLAMSANIKSQKMELTQSCKELGLDIDTIVKSEIETSPISEAIKEVQEQTNKLEVDNQNTFTEEFDFLSLTSLPDLRQAYIYVNTLIEELKKQLDTPQRKYQVYLDKLAKWNSQKDELLGDKDEPRLGTKRYLETKISYIDNELITKINGIRVDRKAIVKDIFDSKKHVLTFYSELKNSVEERLNSVRTDEFSVEIDASFVLDRSFIKDFLNHIKKNRRGSFHGANNPEKIIGSLAEDIDWNDFDSIFSFFDNVVSKLKVYDGKSLSIKEQVSDTKDFYDFIFSLGYFSAKYELRLGGKNLNELSPGEKGLLLLIFYLQLDRDNIPLVIDQPEDNLDNDSIFAVLAKCIRDAKKNRQVILVTHNPNLAIGADAEQIIYVKLEKAENYKFSYESGAIENPRINQKTVDILEGSQPAFVKRRLKYQI